MKFVVFRSEIDSMLCSKSVSTDLTNGYIQGWQMLLFSYLYSYYHVHIFFWLRVSIFFKNFESIDARDDLLSHSPLDSIKNRGLRWDELNIWWNLARQDSLRSCYFSAVPNPRYRSGKKTIGKEKKAKICLAITIDQGETREEKNRIRDFKALHLIHWVIKISRRISI